MTSSKAEPIQARGECAHPKAAVVPALYRGTKARLRRPSERLDELKKRLREPVVAQIIDRHVATGQCGGGSLNCRNLRLLFRAPAAPRFERLYQPR